jgi:hypothetical protein
MKVWRDTRWSCSRTSERGCRQAYYVVLNVRLLRLFLRAHWPSPVG